MKKIPKEELIWDLMVIANKCAVKKAPLMRQKATERAFSEIGYKEYRRNGGKYDLSTFLANFGSWSLSVSEVGFRGARLILNGDTRKAKGKLRQRVLERSGYKCKECGRSEEEGAFLNVDHIIPFSQGGRTIDENLQVLCSCCNLRKHFRKSG